MIYTPFELGSRKHVFIDWDLVEPGYGLAWDARTPASWEMPSGLRLVPHSPLIAPEPLLDELRRIGCASGHEEKGNHCQDHHQYNRAKQD